MASWKVELAIAIGVFAVIGILFGAGIFTPTHTANSAFNTNTNTTNLIPDVRVVSEQAQSPNGIFLVHYIVYGNVMNAGNGTSGPITVALQIKSPESAILLNTNETVVPDILSPKQEGTYTFKFTSDDLGGYNKGEIPLSSFSLSRLTSDDTMGDTSDDQSHHSRSRYLA